MRMKQAWIMHCKESDTKQVSTLPGKLVRRTESLL
jgi:hypothetical protein